MNNNAPINDLEELCRTMRRDIIRAVTRAGSGHLGASLSIVEILTALFFRHLNHHPDDPDWEDRDHFILSKGHGCPALYAAMAHSGYFPVEQLDGLRRLGSCLQGHPYRLKLPALEVSSGSLGQGISVAGGIAMANKLQGRASRVYCLLGDGELQEGEVWEAAMAAAHYKLDNLCAIIDHNRLQIDGPVEEVMGIEDLAARWRSFNWWVNEIPGHDLERILAALEEARRCPGRPSVIIAHTVKGKGVSFMENRPEWHGRIPQEAELVAALRELSEPASISPGHEEA